LQHTRENYDRFAEIFWKVSKYELDGIAVFNKEEKYFDLQKPSLPVFIEDSTIWV
jgi:hypothetical protein